jgi:hypothetical protein
MRTMRTAMKGKIERRKARKDRRVARAKFLHERKMKLEDLKIGLGREIIRPPAPGTAREFLERYGHGFHIFCVNCTNT